MSTRYLFPLICIILFGASAVYPWGFDVHKQINSDAIEFTSAEIQPFFSKNREAIVDKSIEPDTRKDEYPDEFPRHFIDLDRYGEYPFCELPADYDQAVAKFSADTLIRYGTLPWWIDRSTDSLIAAMESGDKDQIIHWAGFLGHYLADAHQPLHTVLNYNGQLTGNDGIHFRYEIGMPDLYLSRYAVEKTQIRQVRQPLQCGFRILRETSTLADSVIRADTRAMAHLSAAEKSALKNEFDIHRDSEYFQQLYHELGPMTWNRLDLASNRIAAYWNYAWRQAGRPKLPLN